MRSDGIAPRQRGAWIETSMSPRLQVLIQASPPGNGGRGLKQYLRLIHAAYDAHRPPATGGVD